MTTQPMYQPIYGRVQNGALVPMTLAEYIASGNIGRNARVYDQTRGRK